MINITDMINNNIKRQKINILWMAALAYVLFGLSFELVDTSVFTSYANPKNFLPATIGLMYGPFGVVGVLIGVVINGALTGTEVVLVFFEAICSLIISLGVWLFWHTNKLYKTAHPVALKKPIHIMHFFSIISVLSFLCTILALLFARYGVNPSLVFGSFMVWNILLSTIAIILMTSIIRIKPIYPQNRQIAPDIDLQLVMEVESIGIIGDMIDELCFEKKLDRKKGFQVQTCIEESIVLILSDETCRSLHITAELSDSVSITMMYDGNRCNPLHIKTGEHADQLGLMLIKQIALRASYSYSGKVNKIHIVL